MDWLLTGLNFIVQQLLAELIVVVAGVMVANSILKWHKERRYGGWRALILAQDGQQLLRRKLSANTAERVLNDEAELSVFLKGLVSPYGHIHCDLVTEGRANRVYEEDVTNRCMTIRISPPYITASVPRPVSQPSEL